MGTPWFMYNVTRGFTDPQHGNHDGWDFGAPKKTPLVSLTGGKVTSHTGWYAWGGEIDTKGPTGITETFAHADRIDVRPGDIVLPGQQVGLSGGEGLPRQYSTGEHIHYSLFGGAPWDNKYAINPGNVINSVKKNWGTGTALGASGIDPSDVGAGVAAIGKAIDDAYMRAETALGNTIKRAGYFILGLALVALGFILLTFAIASKGRQIAEPYAMTAAKVAL